ncbi:hypothetical protein DT075_16595 [Bacillus licheniformis]|nr:hypothetical protein DT075_16595 [Bacillus licheniformis]
MVKIEVEIESEQELHEAIEAGADIIMFDNCPPETASLMTGERVVLNLIQRMSGIATLTKQSIIRLNDPNIAICDTRKTTPGLRILEKYAVKTGGGSNHRFGSEAVFDDNHQCEAVITAKDDGLFAGELVILEGFRLLDETIAVHMLKTDGEAVRKGETIARLKGRAGQKAGAAITVRIVRRLMIKTGTASKSFTQKAGSRSDKTKGL